MERMTLTNEQISDVLGTIELGAARHENLTRLAASTLAGHWHVNDLPWDSMALLPIPENLNNRRLKVFVEFGKHAIKVQLAVMTEMDARAEMQYPEFPLDFKPSPLFAPFMDATPTLYPGLTATFMGAYEAMIAIRGYAEQASYGRRSILGEMAGRAAEDDGRHAKVMRLAGHEWLERFRARFANAEERAAQIRKAILDPIRHFWQLLLEHEYYLLHYDPRSRDEWLKRVQGDLALAERILQLTGLTSEELAYADFRGLTEAENRRLAEQIPAAG